MKKKIIKKKIVKKSNPFQIELDNGELCLVIEAIKKQREIIEKEEFYIPYPHHSREFYEMYLRRYNELLEKLDIRVPRAIFIKMPKF